MSTLISASLDGQEARKLRDGRGIFFPADELFTMEALEDGSMLAMNNSGTAYTYGKLEVSQDGETWTTVNWSDVGSRTDFDLAAAFGKSSFDRGEKIVFRNSDNWSENYYNKYTSFKTPAGKWKAYGDLSKSIRFGYFTKACNMFRLCKGLSDASFLVLPKLQQNQDNLCNGLFTYSSLEKGFTPMDLSSSGERTYESIYKNCRLKSLPDIWAPVTGKHAFSGAFSYADYNDQNVFPDRLDWHFYATANSDAEMPASFMRGMFVNHRFADGTRLFFHFPGELKYSSPNYGLYNLFYRSSGKAEIHWPKHFADENGFIADGGPFFGLQGATAHFDL